LFVHFLTVHSLSQLLFVNHVLHLCKEDVNVVVSSIEHPDSLLPIFDIRDKIDTVVLNEQFQLVHDVAQVLCQVVSCFIICCFARCFFCLAFVVFSLLLFCFLIFFLKSLLGVCLFVLLFMSHSKVVPSDDLADLLVSSLPGLCDPELNASAGVCVYLNAITLQRGAELGPAIPALVEGLLAALVKITHPKVTTLFVLHIMNL
jgi:hypothetical protein